MEPSEWVPPGVTEQREDRSSPPSPPPSLVVDDEAAAALIGEAWRQVHELLHTGKITLTNGRVVAPDEKGFLSVVQALARMKRPKVRRMSIMEDFIAKETHRANP